jgi:hypothetical protein
MKIVLSIEDKGNDIKASHGHGIAPILLSLISEFL